jgi:starch-binding outer membrane protein, SusD/RagB family
MTMIHKQIVEFRFFSKLRAKCLGFMLALLSLSFWSCKKLVQIPEPVNSITTTEVFGSDAQSNSALAGIYTQMINGGLNFLSGSITLNAGLSADELVYYFGSDGSDNWAFNSNTLQSNNGTVLSNFWTPAYSYIYGTNAVIAGLAASTGAHDSVRNELTGEAYFIRALCYFYLTNLFNGVPLVLTTDFNHTALLAKSNQSQIYQQIVSDLLAAKGLLATDFSVGGGERIRPNKWAAEALLARVYLYQGQSSEAKLEADSIIDNSALFSLDTLNGVFLANSTESIWQLQQNNNTSAFFNATPEGYYFNIYSGQNPNFFLSSELVDSFEAGDLRWADWVDSVSYSGITYYFPYKYKVGSLAVSTGTPDVEYYTVLRLGEQYLIRAEAEAMGAGNGIGAAIQDINSIRIRAGLAPYAGGQDEESVLAAIYHERQIELFCEWGNRWLDLKRNGTAVQTLQDKSTGSPTADELWYPIPISELMTDPNLTQNKGY